MKVLVANRGEIACRILKTLREMGIPSVAVHTAVDAEALHLDFADEIAPLGDATEPERAAGGDAAGYLDGAALVAAARAHGATAVHPGYGFLSQSAAFAEECARAGITFIGPSPQAMRLLGDKRASRRAAEECGIPVIPGASAADTVEEAGRAAEQVGFPVLLKAAGGGGGKGMRKVERPADLGEAFAAARREAEAAFADGRLLVERFIAPARHVEVQVLGDGRDAVALGERDCSLQRRYQKIIEEAPSPGLPEATRRALLEEAARLARHSGYRSAGTVEFLVGPDGAHYFLEVNTRLQVEHPVTEWLLGIDLVAAQVALAQGGTLPSAREPRGHAIEARLNAEDPHRGFLPSSGRLLLAEFPARPGVRVDAGIRTGSDVRPEYDPLLAKVIAWGADREQARRRLVEALRDTTILGVATNLAFLLQVLESDPFRQGATHTTLIESTRWPEPEIPPEAVEAARRVLERAPGAAGVGDDALAAAGLAAADGGLDAGDRFSPWRDRDARERLRP
jgi:acetyl/propionyl-CoA carboxylase alpha subunit